MADVLVSNSLCDCFLALACLDLFLELTTTCSCCRYGHRSFGGGGFLLSRTRCPSRLVQRPLSSFTLLEGKPASLPVVI